MGNINVLGIDLAKNHFELHGASQSGSCVLKKSLKKTSINELYQGFIRRCHHCNGGVWWGELLGKEL